MSKSALQKTALLLCMLIAAAQNDVRADQLNVAPVRVSNRQQLLNAISGARAGTRILLAPGIYQGGLAIRGVRGTEAAPIVIASESARRPAIIEGGTSGFHLSDVAFVELHDLVLRNARINGLNIDDGGSVDSPAHHISLRRLQIQNVGDRGNHDGIKLSGVDDFLVVDCSVMRWGRSGSGIDIVGCHDGVVTGCIFRHNDADFGSGVQAKGGSRNVTIRRSRFENAGGRAINAGGSTGLDYFRPKNAGYEAKDITVEDCTIVGSMAPVAFVGVDGAIVRFNTIYRPTRWVARILQENQNPRFVNCRNGRFENNVIAFRSSELRTSVNVGPNTSPESFIFRNNLWTCVDRPGDTRRMIRLPTAETGGVYDRAIKFVDPDNGNYELVSPTSRFRAGVRTQRDD